MTTSPGTPLKPVKPVLASPLRAWRGAASLATVFWGYGVAVSGLLVLAFVAALMRGDEGLQQALIVVFVVYTAWVMVSVWRCAETAKTPWGLIARLLTVAWVGNTVLVVGFLQLRLLEGYLGR